MTADRQQRLLEAFAEYERARSRLTEGQTTIQLQPGTRLMRLQRLDYGWRVWLATRDYIHGSFLEVHNDGTIMRYETRFDEGDEVFKVRPSDDEIRR